MFQRAINDYFSEIWASKSRIWKDKFFGVYFFNLGIWPLWAFSSFWMESTRDFGRYLFFLIPLFLCMPAVRVVEKGLPKILQLSPLNRQEKVRYLSCAILVQACVPAIIGMCFISIAMLLFDEGWKLWEVLVSGSCLISIGIGKNAFPSNASYTAQMYKHREIIAIVLLIVISIINITPHALNFVDNCVGIWRYVCAIAFWSMILLDIWAIIKMIPREIERCVEYEWGKVETERTVKA